VAFVIVIILLLVVVGVFDRLFGGWSVFLLGICPLIFGCAEDE